MISTATTTIAPCTQPRPAPDPPPSACKEVPIPSLYVAQLLLGQHQPHTSNSKNPCATWMAASAFLSADCEVYE